MQSIDLLFEIMGDALPWETYYCLLLYNNNYFWNLVILYGMINCHICSAKHVTHWNSRQQCSHFRCIPVDESRTRSLPGPCHHEVKCSNHHAKLCTFDSINNIYYIPSPYSMVGVFWPRSQTKRATSQLCSK